MRIDGEPSLDLSRSSEEIPEAAEDGALSKDTFRRLEPREELQ